MKGQQSCLHCWTRVGGSPIPAPPQRRRHSAAWLPCDAGSPLGLVTAPAGAESSDMQEGGAWSDRCLHPHAFHEAPGSGAGSRAHHCMPLCSVRTLTEPPDLPVPATSHDVASPTLASGRDASRRCLCERAGLSGCCGSPWSFGRLIGSHPLGLEPPVALQSSSGPLAYRSSYYSLSINCSHYSTHIHTHASC